MRFRLASRSEFRVIAQVCEETFGRESRDHGQRGHVTPPCSPWPWSW